MYLRRAPQRFHGGRLSRWLRHCCTRRRHFRQMAIKLIRSLCRSCRKLTFGGRSGAHLCSSDDQL
jgi:hypothetical protein